MKDEFIIINKTALQRIEELEIAAMELYNLVHDSASDVVFKIRANQLYDVIKKKEIQSIPLIPEIEKAFDVSNNYTQKSFDEYKQDYISNLKLDI